MSNFELTMVYGCFGIAALFMGGFWGVIFKQIIPTMVFAAIGFVLIGMGYHTSPFKEEK